MNSHQLPFTFEEYLLQTDDLYLNNLRQIPIFRLTSDQISEKFMTEFAAVFYHIRGHFIHFMWYLANFTEDKAVKHILIDNIKDELGFPDKRSHELLYADFANACGINIQSELINETHNLPFVKQFNREHVLWLSKKNAIQQFAGFSAYERLDNIDYPILLALTKLFNIPEKTRLFFTVHIHVKHFDATLHPLLPTWEKDPALIKESFSFIYQHQLNMWQSLSNYLMPFLN